MLAVLAVLLFLIFLFLSSIHVYWAFGGRWGSKAVFPTKNDAIPPAFPGPIPTLIVALGLLAFGLFYLVKGGIFTVALPDWLNQYGLLVLGSLFIMRAIGEFRYVGFFKKYRATAFGKNDTRYYSPLCVFIGVATFVLHFAG